MCLDKKSIEPVLQHVKDISCIKAEADVEKDYHNGPAQPWETSRSATLRVQSNQEDYKESVSQVLLGRHGAEEAVEDDIVAVAPH